VDPARLGRWLDTFAARHGGYAVDPVPGGLRVRAYDGELAELRTPPGAPDRPDLAGFLAEAGQPRRLALLLVRRGGTAVGVALGERLLVSKVHTGYVQGRTAAGGWSQHRFARRRDNQARAAAGDAADLAVRLLLPDIEQLAAVLGGGDRRSVEAVLADARLAPVRQRLDERFLDVPDPRLAVLQDAVRAARRVHIRLTAPAN